MWKREFLWKSKEHARRPGFPRVHLMQRVADDASEKQWHVLKVSELLRCISCAYHDHMISSAL